MKDTDTIDSYLNIVLTFILGYSLNSHNQVINLGIHLINNN